MVSIIKLFFHILTVLTWGLVFSISQPRSLCLKIDGVDFVVNCRNGLIRYNAYSGLNVVRLCVITF